MNNIFSQKFWEKLNFSLQLQIRMEKRGGYSNTYEKLFTSVKITTNDVEDYRVPHDRLQRFFDISHRAL